MSNRIPRIFAFFVTMLLAMTGLLAAVTQVATAESVMSQLGQDIDGEATGDRVTSVSFSADGSRVAVGSNENDGTLSDPFSIAGHVRIFEYIGNSWVQLGADIDGQDANERSGSSVSLSADGTRVAIGAPGNSTNGFSAGAVRVYSYNGAAWVQVGVDIPGEAAGDFSGSAVSLSTGGTRVAIGAYGNDGGGAGSGHVRVYEYVNSAWVQLGADIDGEATADYSGFSVDLTSDGTRVSIGAYGNDGNGDFAGHVRVYGLVGSSWVQVGQDINGEATGDGSGGRDGVSISSNGNRVAIGAKENDGGGSNAGHIRVYDLVNGSWAQVGSDIDGKEVGESSGDSLDMSPDGSRIVIGAPYQSGKARVYEYIGSDWIQLGADVLGQAVSDNGGDFVGISGDGLRFAVGSFHHDSGRGNVRIFSISQVSPTASVSDTSAPKLASTGSDESITGLWIGSILFVITLGAAAMLFSRLRNRQNKQLSSSIDNQRD